jgi:hypothetical protein
VLIGTASVAELAAAAPTIERFVAEPIVLGEATWFQMTAEMRNGAREAVLPPSLHPTVPPVLSIQAARVKESPWGEFALVLVRVGCRSGVRARGFTTAMLVSNEAACAGLRNGLGFPARVANVVIAHGYAGVSVDVMLHGRLVLAAAGIDPEPMSPDDVQYTGSLNLAHTPRGLRLVQVEMDHASRQVERVRTTLRAFDAAALGNPLLDPYYVVSGSVAVGDVTIPPVRFVCRPDELAFTGTEPVSG